MGQVEIMSRQLETMSDQILKAVDDLQIEHGEGLTGIVAPRSFRFNIPEVRFQIGRPTEGDLAREISTALGVSPDSVRMDLKGPEMEVRVLRDRPGRLPLSKVTQGLEHGLYTAALGIDDEGSPLVVGLGSDKGRNMLIVGDQDSGATELLKTIIESNAQRHPARTRINLSGGSIKELNEVGETIVARERGKDASARPVLLAIPDADVLLGHERSRAMMAEILRRGADVRVHTVAVASNPEVLDPLMERAKVDPFPVLVRGNGFAQRVFPGEFELRYQGEIIPFTAASVEEETIPPGTSGRGNIIQFPIQKLLNP